MGICNNYNLVKTPIKITRNELNSLDVFEIKDIADNYVIFIVPCLSDDEYYERIEILSQGKCWGRVRISKLLCEKLALRVRVTTGLS